MSLSHTDVLPLLAVIGGGAVAVLASSSLALSSSDPSTDPFVEVSTHVEAPTRVEGTSLGPLWSEASVASFHAIEHLETIQGQHRDVLGLVRALPMERGGERTRAIESIRAQKDQMHDAVQHLERDLRRATGSMPVADPEATLALLNAANMIRDSKLEEKLLYSRGTVEQWDPQSALTLELNIEGDLRSIRGQIETPPRIYIDGEPMRSAPTDLNTNDVRSIEVIKGEAAITLYGEQASGGVILITLKESGRSTGN